MTRRLIVVRHASAVSAARGASDHDRSLDGAGRRALPWLATEVGRLGPVDVVLASTARRVRETVAGLLAGAPPTPIEWSAALYLAAVPELFEIIRAAEPTARCVALCGHNPGLHEFVLDLAAPGQQGRPTAGFPTAAVAAFDVESPWQALMPGDGRLVSVTSPKDRG